MGIPIIAGFGEGRKRGRTPSKGGGTKLGYSPKPYVPPVVPPVSSGDDYDESLFVPQEEDNTFSQGNLSKQYERSIDQVPFMMGVRGPGTLRARGINPHATTLGDKKN